MEKPAYRPVEPNDHARGASSDETETFLDSPDWTPHKKPRCNTHLAGAVWATLVLLILVVILNIASFTRDWSSNSHGCSSPSSYYLRTPTGKVYPSQVTRTYWDYDDNFLNFNVTLATEFWKGLFPVGDGIVGLTQDEVKSLDLTESAPAFDDPSKSIYLVGGFHQLHCLSQLRSLVIKLHENPSFSISDPTYRHTMHCADVLRQQILCHADGTLIYKRPQDKWPGDGALRTCNNFDALTRWTRDHAHVSADGKPEIDPAHPS